MVGIRMTGLSDWTRLAAIDPARLAEMHENAAELQAIMAGVSLDDIEYLPSHALAHLRNRLSEAGIVPPGVGKETLEIAAAEEAAQLHLERRVGKKSHNRTAEFVAASMASEQERMEQGHSTRASGLRNTQFNNQVRLTASRLRQAGIAPIKHADGNIRTQTRFDPKKSGFKMPGKSTGITCPSCGRSDSLRGARGGYVCLACRWGKEVATQGRNDAGGRMFAPYKSW